MQSYKQKENSMIRKAWVAHPTFNHILVSPLGYAYNSKTNNFIGNKNIDSKYQQVSLAKGKTEYMHRLVFSVYYPEIDISTLQINHIDGDRSNNMISNLEVVTAQENTILSLPNRSTKKNSLTIDEHKLIFDLYSTGLSQGKVRRKVEECIGRNLDPGFVNRILNGKVYKQWYQLHK